MANEIGFSYQASQDNRKKRALLRVLLVISAMLVLLGGCAVLWWNNIIFTTGPSQKNVQREASQMISEITPNLPGSPTLGEAKSYYRTCGPGELPINYASAGISVRFTGVPESFHDGFEKAVQERFWKTPEGRAVDTTKESTWGAVVNWDSQSSKSGTIEVGIECGNVARWP
jgi:hypothetical protein